MVLRIANKNWRYSVGMNGASSFLVREIRFKTRPKIRCGEQRIGLETAESSTLQ
jgi:hypothetical protein